MNFELVGLFAVIALAVSILVIVCQAKKKSSFHSLKTSPSEDKPNIDDITGCTPTGSCDCGVATNAKAYKYNYPPGSFSCGKTTGPGPDYDGCMSWWSNPLGGRKDAYAAAYNMCIWSLGKYGCYADYGTPKGMNVCCGQTGTVKNIEKDMSNKQTLLQKL